MVTEILILRNEPSITTISRNKENKEAYCLNGNTNKEPIGFGIGKGQTISNLLLENGERYAVGLSSSKTYFSERAKVSFTN